MVRENGARRLRGIATIDLSDRRIVTGFSFNAEGSEAGVATWFPLPESAARLLFDAQVDAVILRLTRPSER